MDTQDYLKIAYNWAFDASSDPHTQNGAVVVFGKEVVGYGTNRLPMGVASLPERLTRDEKLKWLIHAELDAILDATRIDYVVGATLYCPWACCCDCAKAIIQSGIVKVVTHKEMMDKTPDYWKPSIEIGKTMLAEAHITFEEWSGRVGATNLFRGEIWNP